MVIEFQPQIRFFGIRKEIDRHDFHRILLIVGGHHGHADPWLLIQTEGDNAELVAGRHIIAVGFDPFEKELGESAVLFSKPVNGSCNGYRQAADQIKRIALDQRRAVLLQYSAVTRDEA